ncbi:gamma-aminobutyric acid type B receptor subunit 1-like [Gigantopelta aegis]|uniref:gamma-aminobutyric acid type B receptor subunit 1-like n=1 Tax=Gigantopelta aegis TaxID=1735272 RepID=UPI001B88A864|nr:gamma-aminobutyric acid type B receptor subunit 1-like [Gigantopelta aegis]
MFARRSFVFLLLLQGQTFAVLKNLYILGMLPMEGPWNGGVGVLPAAKVALGYVNKNMDALPGYRVNMIWNNTKCNPGVGSKILGDMMCSGKTFIMLLGAGCSPVSEIVAEAAQFWNLVQVSYSSSSPVLSDKHRFPYFFRVVANQHKHNYLRVAFLQYFNWTKVTTIHQSEQVFGLMVEHIENILITKNIKVMNKFVFTNSPRVFVQKLKDDDARIIIGAFYTDKARKVFCEAFKIRFSGPKIVWLLPANLEHNWWKGNNTDCTGNEILSAAGNYFIITDYFKYFGTEKDDNGITLQQFMNDYKKMTHYQTLTGNYHAQATYDAVWVIVQALKATMADLQNTGFGLEDFTYTNRYIGELIKNNTLRVNFNSITGRVFFDKNGDTIRLSMVKQFQEGKLVEVAHYDQRNEFIWSDSTPVFWINGEPPKDSLEMVMDPVSLLKPLYATMCVIAALGILLALSFLTFNIKFRNNRIIKMSSPNINSAILLGCIISYVFVFIQGIETREMPILCQVRLYFFIIAFSLLFGALFAKTWRLYILLIKMRKLNKQVSKDTHLFIEIGLIAGVNMSIVVLWSIISPSYSKEMKLQNMVDPDNDRVVIPTLWHCTSKHDKYFTGILVSFQAIISLIGLCLAFTTRKVTIPELNDSKEIGLCIYNVVVLSALGIVVPFLPENHLNIKYGLGCGLIIIGATVTQCLIFIPKVQALDTLMQSKGDETEYRAIPPTKTSLSVKMNGAS